MASADSLSFLQNEIVKNKKIVTYRLLSRKIGIHVNTAKNDLATFYAQNRESSQPVHATFLVSGTISTDVNAKGDTMDVDGSEASHMSKARIVLATEHDLEDVKSSFARVRSCHVYSLSLFPALDLSALYEVAQVTREIDKSSDNKFLTSVGKIVSDNFKSMPSGKVKGPTAMKTQAAVVKATPVTKSNNEERPLAKPSVNDDKPKPKATGKLDWSKAKAKEVKKGPIQRSSTSKASEASDATSNSSRTIVQRGTKRKSDMFPQKIEKEESEEEVSLKKPAQPTSNSKMNSEKEDMTPSLMRVQRGVVLSDDDGDEAVVKPKLGRKPKIDVSDDILDPERSVRAMMDIDDSEVTKASWPRSTVKDVNENEDNTEEQPQGPQSQDVDMDEDSDPAPKSKPRKRKEKKVVPTGRNGLKKKRIVKSRMKTDEKGYMVTEDYSSYESVDEEAEVEAKPKTSKSKKAQLNGTVQPELEMDVTGTCQEQPKPRAEGKKPVAKNTLNKGRTSVGGQKNITNFFCTGGGKSKK